MEMVIGLWRDQQQYEMLLRCSEKKDMTEWNEWRNNNSEEKIWLEGANFIGAHLERANLGGANLKCACFIGAFLNGVNFGLANLTNSNFLSAHLEGAGFGLAHLECANFHSAHLERAVFFKVYLYGAYFKVAFLEDATFMEADLTGANFVFAHLEGTKFSEVYLDGADFSYAIVNGKTFIVSCTIDDKTNFTGVGLSSVRVGPRIKCRLENNIRRMQWEKWYAENSIKNRYDVKISKAYPNIFKWLDRLYLCPVKGFWWVSDYGSNTSRILKMFLRMVCVFMILYGMIDYFEPRILEQIQPIQLHTAGLWMLQLLCFATATMVTLGFGGVNVAVIPDSPWLSALALIAVTLNLLTGYFLLAVLVTRLGILFQSQGPD
ncbi:MAG: pentapeptide repeat-containing protein [Synergistaceae bacterium]|nr:pentapeptide repeat-containing protein [Synergistaceae bacterium]MBP9626971.1 pentapeptide repeat-containing protein [Synergistaceae bacterium]MBP9958626.1 pentapeptide repeat-containing protein [Synergistaceae bacterium]